MEQQTGSHVTTQARDFLKIRLQRMVKAVLAEQQLNDSSGYLIFIRDQHRPLISKVIWIAAAFICAGLFTFQTYDRSSHYFSYPVSTQGFIKKRSLQTFPHLTLCLGKTKGYSEFLLKLPRQNTVCFHHAIRDALYNPGNFTMEEIWEIFNTTTAVVSANGISGRLVTPLDVETKATVWGLCSTFSFRSSIPLSVDDGRYEIILGRYDGRCTGPALIYMYLHDESVTLTGHRHREISSNTRHTFAVSIREVRFVNHPQNPCISEEEYQECEENCFTSFLKEYVKCRLPFFPAKLNLNYCNLSYNMIDNWLKGHDYLTGIRKNKLPCSCVRKCHHRTITESHSSGVKYDNQTVIILELYDSYETLIHERFSYSFVDFLCTIGGNSGLYIGASLLSIIKFITTAVALKKKKKVNKFAVDDPLFRKVLKTFEIWNQSNVKKKSMVMQQTKKTKAAFKISAIVIVSSFWLIIVLNRIIYFLDYRSMISVNVSFKVALKFPEIIICSGDPSVLQLQKEAARRKNESNFCDVKVWDLFDLPKHRITTIIWENQELKPLQSFIHQRSIAVFDGTCITTDEPTEEEPKFLSRWFLEVHKYGRYGICGTNYMKVYVKDVDGRLDYFQYRYFPSSTISKLTFVIKEIRIDESITKCSSEKKYRICMDRCLAKKLFYHITCRLPYMHAFVKLPLCNTSSSAKHSHLKFMEVYLVPPSSLNCDCLPQCLTRIFETRMETDHFNRSLIVLNAAHTVVETYKRVQTYSFVQLLCDIGGLLGSLLGLSILTIVEIIVSHTENRAKKRNPMPVRILVH